MIGQKVERKKEKMRSKSCLICNVPKIIYDKLCQYVQVQFAYRKTFSQQGLKAEVKETSIPKVTTSGSGYRCKCR